MKRTFPVILAITSGAILAVSAFLNPKFAIFGTSVELIEVQILKGVTIIAGFTLLLGVFSILRVNLHAFQRDNKDRWYKLATIIALFAMAIPGIFPDPSTEIGKSLYTFLPGWVGVYGGQNGIIVNWLFNKLDAPMMSTMFAILAFYIASAAYRAFRARSLDATMLLVAALLVMFWRVPMGEEILVAITPEFPEWINTFLMRGVNSAVQRGIIIGAALGAASMSLRILLGIERIYLGKS